MGRWSDLAFVYSRPHGRYIQRFQLRQQKLANVLGMRSGQQKLEGMKLRTNSAYEQRNEVPSPVFVDKDWVPNGGRPEQNYENAGSG